MSFEKKTLHFLVFTDLDGTLLDFSTYSFEQARDALRLLSEKRIPLIFCTSKTRAETEKYRALLDNRHPFISENGGAMFIPRNYFPFALSTGKKDDQYDIIELGTPYAEIRRVLSLIQERFPGIVRGFGDLEAEDIAALCGLNVSDAALAMARDYDEPFLLENPAGEDDVRKMAASSQLQVVKGGRFFHLTGKNDKGEAVRRLTENYKKIWDGLRTIGLGDSANDLSMLQSVDEPVLVQKPDGSYDSSVRLSRLTYAPGRGPEGWNAALCRLLSPSLNLQHEGG